VAPGGEEDADTGGVSALRFGRNQDTYFSFRQLLPQKYLFSLTAKNLAIEYLGKFEKICRNIFSPL
jgi:hypothetical protein